jgi:hypothetical protein
MASGYNMRVGDADREEVASQLREHYATGRLTLDELNERLDQAFAAKTRADLSTVTRDLPSAAQPAAGVPFEGNGWTGPGWQEQGRQGQAWRGPMATRPDQYRRGGWDDRQGQGSRHSHGAFAPLIGLVWLCVILGSVMIFGLGGDRPFIIVLFLAAIALVKRLIGRGRRRR